ncbi:MAG: hypothetical protein WC827_03930 [Candidatus Paceibacterota bacterium]|jgi:hypothetical protein
MGNRSRAGGMSFTMVRPPSDFGYNAKSMSVWGFHEIIKNLSVEILRMTGGSKEGLLDVAKFIRRDMATNQPFVPKDKGDLDLSWTVFPRTEGNKHGITFGFSANYALWVHEMIGPDIKWSKPGSGPKFLQKAIERNHDTILQIIADKMKVK